MCDYSLMGIPNRLATAGEDLIIHRFQARLIIRDIPRSLQRAYGLRSDMEEAVFTQLAAAAESYRDAVRFNNGTEVLLQRFAEGQRVRVLSVSSGEEWESQPVHRTAMRLA